MRYIFTLKNLLALFFMTAGSIFLHETYKERTVFFFSPEELGPMTYPRYLLWGWVGLSFLYLVIPRKPIDLKEIKESFPTLTAALLAIIFYIVLFKYVGLIVSTFLFLILFFYVLHYRHMSKMVLIAISTALLSWLIFVKFLGVPMPSGVFNGLFG